jgi:hypothetical protein
MNRVLGKKEDIPEKNKGAQRTGRAANEISLLAIGNPFLHLRLGQCQFELGNFDRAADELTRAHVGAGAEIFEGADKYFTFLKTRLNPPPVGW